MTTQGKSSRDYRLKAYKQGAVRSEDGEYTPRRDVKALVSKRIAMRGLTSFTRQQHPAG